MKVLLDFDENRATISECSCASMSTATRRPCVSLWRRSCGVEDGIARERRIEIGERNPAHAEVVSGLAEGDRIILHTSDKVSDGVTVTARRQPGG